MRGKKVFWGVYFLLAAVFILVWKLGVIPTGSGFGFSFWGILFTILLVALTVKGIFDKSFGEILFSLAFLAWIHDDALGITAITPWYILGAALFATIGLNLIFHNNKKWNTDHHVMWDDHAKSHKNPNAHYASDMKEASEQVDGEKVWFKNNCGSTIKYVKSQNFKYAELNNTFGSMKVYLDSVQIQDGVIPEICVDSSFGEVQIYVPRTWALQNQCQASFGSVEEKNSPQTTGAPVVRLTGKVSFGEVAIFYV